MLDTCQKLLLVTCRINAGFDRRFGPKEMCAILTTNLAATLITLVAGALVFKWGQKAETQE